jgi:RNA polymerase sigma-70 factor, ECF subfamily
MSVASGAVLGQARDTELLGMAAAGDPAAFDAVLVPRLDRVYRLAMSICRDEADARDATQDACVQAWRELPRLRDRSRFDAWLSQIVVNSCRATLRRRRRGRVREISTDDATVTWEPQATARLAAAPADDRLAEREAIQRAFERLGPDDRSLLALHYVEERPLADIGRQLRLPVGTVKWRLFNARRALNAALKAEAR